VPIFGKNEWFFRFLRRAAGRFSGVSEKKVLPATRWFKGVSEKSCGKSEKKFWCFGKWLYLCTRFRQGSGSEKARLPEGKSTLKQLGR
jgi:hypothetical protein